MPVSEYYQISDVLDVVRQVDPAKILDIGVGFGKWGVNCREALDVYYHRFLPSEWSIVIDGVEIFDGYKNPLWDAAYNRVYVGDAREVLDGLGDYDLVLCCDVIEHLEKEDGLRLLYGMLEHSPVAIITSPTAFHPQGAVMGNEYEKHRSVWSRFDFAGRPHRFKEIEESFMVVVGRDEASIGKIRIRHPLDALGVRKGTRELLKLVVRRLKSRMNGRVTFTRP